MSKELEFLSRWAAAGRLNRRVFLGRAAALGVSATFANTLLSSAVRAQGPQKGGDLRMGLSGGESTNSLDPATWLTQVPQNFGSTWGELLVQSDPELVPIIATCASVDSLHRMTRSDRFIDAYVVAGSDHLTAYQLYQDALEQCGRLGDVYGLPRQVARPLPSCLRPAPTTVRANRRARRRDDAPVQGPYPYPAAPGPSD